MGSLQSVDSAAPHPPFGGRLERLRTRRGDIGHKPVLRVAQGVRRDGPSLAHLFASFGVTGKDATALPMHMGRVRNRFMVNLDLRYPRAAALSACVVALALLASLEGLTLGTTVGVLRLMADRHYASDVLVGGRFARRRRFPLRPGAWTPRNGALAVTVDQGLERRGVRERSHWMPWVMKAQSTM